MKSCIECGSMQLLSDFYRHPESIDGHAGICKKCHKARMKLRRLTNPKVQEHDRQRAKTPEARARAAVIGRKWRQDNPAAYKAQTAVGNAVRDKRLFKLPCQICGTSEHVHAHHDDYSRPLDVKWLCAKCHHRIHATFPQLGGHYEASQ